MNQFVSTGKVTSLVAKKDFLLATRIEEAIRKNESLEALSSGSIRRDISRAKISEQKNSNATKMSKASDSKQKVKGKAATGSTSRSTHAKVATSKTYGRKSPSTKPVKTPTPAKSVKTVRISKVAKSNNGRKSTKLSSVTKATKLRVVGFRGRNSSTGKRAVGA